MYSYKQELLSSRPKKGSHNVTTNGRAMGSFAKNFEINWLRYNRTSLCSNTCNPRWTRAGMPDCRPPDTNTEGINILLLGTDGNNPTYSERVVPHAKAL